MGRTRRFLMLCLTVGILGGSAFSAASSPTKGNATRPARQAVTSDGKAKFIVRTSPEVQLSEIAFDLRKMGARVLDTIPPLNLIHIASDRADFRSEALAVHGIVGIGRDMWRYRLPDRPGDLTAVDPPVVPPDVAEDYSLQWGMHQIGADALHADGVLGDSSIAVAVLDTGIDPNNPELADRIDPERSKSFIEEGLDSLVGWTDLSGHGSHVAGIIAASKNGYGVVGVAPRTTLIAVKVLGFDGYGTDYGVIAGIKHAVDVGARVINMSIGNGIGDATDCTGKDYYPANDPEGLAVRDGYEAAIDYANDNGVLVVTAAGNEKLNADLMRPDGTPRCILMPVGQGRVNVGVSATGPIGQRDFDQPAFYTNYGTTIVDLAAPGGNSGVIAEVRGIRASGPVDARDWILSTWSTRALQPIWGDPTYGPNLYQRDLGTSMATPHVAGAAALVLAKNPDLSAQAVADILYGSADSFPGVSRYGHGRLNVYNAIHSMD